MVAVGGVMVVIVVVLGKSAAAVIHPFASVKLSKVYVPAVFTLTVSLLNGASSPLFKLCDSAPAISMVKGAFPLVNVTVNKADESTAQIDLPPEIVASGFSKWFKSISADTEQLSPTPATSTLYLPFSDTEVKMVLGPDSPL